MTKEDFEERLSKLIEGKRENDAESKRLDSALTDLRNAYNNPSLDELAKVEIPQGQVKRD